MNADLPYTIPAEGDYITRVEELDLTRSLNSRALTKITLVDLRTMHRFFLYRFGNVTVEWVYIKRNTADIHIRVKHETHNGLIRFVVTLLAINKIK